MFNKFLIFGVGTLFGAYMSLSTLVTISLADANLKLKKELKKSKISETEKES